jgi:putative nucleotidyltransferase with HDIG domain
MASTKRITVDQLKPGMFVVAMDQPWYRTPFLFHKRLIATHDDIARMQCAGIREVTIDTDQGIDVTDAPAHNGVASQVEAVSPRGAVSSDQPPPIGSEGQGSMEVAQTTFREATAAMERIFADIEAGHAPTLRSVQSIVAGVMNRILLHQESMLMQFCVQKMRRFDRTLASHGIDVCVLSLIVTAEQGLKDCDRESLGMGAILHDIGYIRLPRNLYRKTGVLLPQEKSLMQQHPQLGLTVLAQLANVPDLVRDIVAQHHEHYNGSGYPNRLTGASLSQLVQIVGLVDTYDGMVSPRFGRPAMLPHDAIRQLFVLGEKGRFDKAVVEMAIKALGVYPIGSLIKLNTGECAVVTGLNHEHRLKPKISIITDTKGQIFSEPMTHDLSSESGQHQSARAILRALDPKIEHVNVAAYLESSSGR